MTQRTAAAFMDALLPFSRIDQSENYARFFKTAKGEYGEGDIFIGVRVPDTRKVCKEFADLPIDEVALLFESPVHEHRLGASIIMVMQASKGGEPERKKLYTAYMRALDEGQINNWDIVDSSADGVLGRYLEDKDHSPLFSLARREELWHRRAAVLASYWFIKKGDPSTTLQLAELLLTDRRDLIQKAVGWMLREVGKRIDRALLLDFLDQHAHEMPRTMLRYSIEHLPVYTKKRYMAAVRMSESS